MKTKEYNPDVEIINTFNADWKDDPLTVMKEVDDVLKTFGLEVLQHTDQSDNYIFEIIKRPETV